VSHESLIKVAQLMEENIEKPLSLDEIASATGLSRRQIERLFKRHLNCVPKRYYLQMRLRRARELLLQTSMRSSISPPPAASSRRRISRRCYRAQFGCPPSTERQTRLGKSGALARPPARPLKQARRGSCLNATGVRLGCRWRTRGGREVAIAPGTLPLPCKARAPARPLSRMEISTMAEPVDAEFKLSDLNDQELTSRSTMISTTASGSRSRKPRASS